MRRFDVIVLGAGAAGLFAAIHAGRRNRRVLLLDHADKPGKKILISGGGRSNFTNLHCTPENFLSENPHFARSALARYTQHDFIALVERHRIPYHEKTLGQLFCDRTSRDIVAMLEAEAALADVRTELDTRILSVRSDAPRTFTLETSTGTLHSQSLIIATGGLSIPKMGATAFGYQLAEQFGLRIVPPRPALVPLTFSPPDRDLWCDLSGVSAEVLASTSAPTARNRKPPLFREKALITHRGLSGPAILQISSYWQPGQSIALDLAPGREVLAPLLTPNGPRDTTAAFTALRTALPTRWAERFLATHAPNQPRILSNTTIAALERELHAWRLTPAGTEGYPKAEVTAGGVSTAELNPQTMESRKVPGLYFVGEVVDVTGWLGGFNFQWAWSSAFCAAQSA